MTIEEFAKNHRVTVKTIKKWISDGLLPGASIKDNYIPPSARRPYTDTRARNAKAIYKSIVYAARNQLNVLPQLYKICQSEFDGYIEELVHVGLIRLRVADGVTYYDATIKATQYNEKQIVQAINLLLGTCVKSGVQGLVEGLAG